MTTFKSPSVLEQTNESTRTNVFESYYANTSGFVGARRVIEDVEGLRESYEGVWNELSDEERNQIINESIIRPEAVLKYNHDDDEGETQRDDKNRLLPFGASQIYPRLKHPTGQKKVIVEDTSGSQGEDLDSASSGCTYTIQDEHSAPFSWKTRSQMDLSFEFGRITTIVDDDEVDEVEDDGSGIGHGDGHVGDLTLLAGPPSKILTNPSQYTQAIRMSRGNPSFAKAVQIPVVPTIPKPERQQKDTSRMIPPEQINNFVYSNAENRLVLDFDKGVDTKMEKQSSLTEESFDALPDSSLTSGRSSSPDSVKSSRGLMRKVKKSLAPTKFSTLRRKSQERLSSLQEDLFKRHSLNTKSQSSSQSSLTEPKRTSLQPSSAPKLVKPSVPPPRPPVPTRPKGFEANSLPDKVPMKPKLPPPKPPVRRESQQIQKDDTKDTCIKGESKKVSGDDELGDFKIDLKTDSDLPKTGFDFLDNW